MRHIKKFEAKLVKNEDLKFSFSDIRFYFQGLLDDGWTVKPNAVSSSDHIAAVNKDSKWGGRSHNYRGQLENVSGYRIGVIIQKLKNYDGNCLEFVVGNSKMTGLTHINRGWNYEEEMNDIHELILIVEEIKGRMEDDGYEVYFSKRNDDPDKPNGFGGDNRVIGIYFDILKYKRV